MFDFSQKRKIRAFLYHRATLVVMFTLVLFFAHSTWSVWQKKQISEDSKGVAETHLQELRSHDDDLASHIERLKTSRGVEDEIRSKFSVAKNGESVVVVVPGTVDSATTTNPTGFWQGVKSFFFR